MPPEVSNRPTRGMDDNDFSELHQCFVTGPQSVQQGEVIFQLQAWAMLDEYVKDFKENIKGEQDNEQRAGAFAEIASNVDQLSVHVNVAGCAVDPETSLVRWNRKRVTSSHTVHVPPELASSSLKCNVEIEDPSASRGRPIFAKEFTVKRHISAEAAPNSLLTEGVLAAALQGLVPVEQRSNDQHGIDANPPSPIREHSGSSRPTLAVGALRASGGPVMMGSAIFWEASTGLCTTVAHVVLDCAHVDGALDPKTWGVAIGVGSADSPVRWLYKAHIVSISYPPTLKPEWHSTIAAWSDVPTAPGQPGLDLAVLKIHDFLDSGTSKPFAESNTASFSDNQLTALKLGDSDRAPPDSEVRIYGFGHGGHHGLAAFTPGGISNKRPEMISVTATMLAGHSGGMLLDSAGTVIGWCMGSQMVAVDGAAGRVPSGLHYVCPINLLRAALEAALAAKPGGSLEEKLQGSVPLRAPR